MSFTYPWVWIPISLWHYSWHMILELLHCYSQCLYISLRCLPYNFNCLPKQQNFGLDQTESTRRQQNKYDFKVETCSWRGRKHFEKRRKCWSPAFFPLLSQAQHPRHLSGTLTYTSQVQTSFTKGLSRAHYTKLCMHEICIRRLDLLTFSQTSPGF